MQIAKFFASLGFKVDMTDLNAFENKLKDVRKSSALFARNLKVLSNRLQEVNDKVKRVNEKLDLTSQKKGAGGVSEAYSKLANSLLLATTYVDKFASESQKAQFKLEDITGKVNKGANAWEKYYKQVKLAKEELKGLNTQITAAKGHPPRINIRADTRVYGGGGAAAPRVTNPFINPATGQPYGMSGLGGNSAFFLGGIPNFLKSMTPAGMLAGGALGAGVALKQVIDSGRDMQKMEQMLLQASANTETFQHNLEFTKRTADEMAVSVLEFGRAYSKILAAAERTPLSLKDTQDITFGFSKFMRSINLNAADQAGVFRQLGQMFNTGRIQQDEINSMADRGINMNKYLRQAAEQLGIKDYTKLQESGKADPIKLIPRVAKLLAEAANNNNAYEKSLQTSIAAQQRFTNALQLASSEMMKAGLDEILMELFNLLTDIFELLKPVVVGILQVVKGFIYLAKGIGSATKEIGSFLNEHKILAASLGIGIGLFVAYRQAIKYGIPLWLQFASAGVTALMKLRLALGMAGLLGVLYALYEFGKAYEKHLSGETNFVTVMISQVEVAISAWELLFAVIGRGFRKLTNNRVGNYLGELYDESVLGKLFSGDLIGGKKSPVFTTPTMNDVANQMQSATTTYNRNIELTGRFTLYDTSGKVIGEGRSNMINLGVLGQ